MAVAVVYPQNFLLAHTGHDHSRDSTESQPAPEMQHETTPAAPASPASKADTDGDPEASPDQQATEADQDAAATETPPQKQQTTETVVQPSASEAAPQTEQAGTWGNLGGELLFVLVLVGPLALRQLRRLI